MNAKTNDVNTNRINCFGGLIESYFTPNFTYINIFIKMLYVLRPDSTTTAPPAPTTTSTTEAG